VTLLEHDKFDLIKLIRNNRNVILYCTLLARAQNPAERATIEAKMSSDDELSSILAALREVVQAVVDVYQSFISS
jgi:pre-mRNA-splicing helicase BRR2